LVLLGFAALEAKKVYNTVPKFAWTFLNVCQFSVREVKGQPLVSYWTDIYLSSLRCSWVSAARISMSGHSLHRRLPPATYSLADYNWLTWTNGTVAYIYYQSELLCSWQTYHRSNQLCTQYPNSSNSK